jgi:glycosyltransferase involved in cell wall biosynthesis
LGAKGSQLDDFARLRSDIYLRHSATDPEGYLRLARALTGQSKQLDPMMAGMARLHALARMEDSGLELLSEPESVFDSGGGTGLGDSPYIDRYLADVLRVWAGSDRPGQREKALQLFHDIAMSATGSDGKKSTGTGIAKAGFAVACSAGIQPYDEGFTALALGNHDDTATMLEALAYAASGGFQSLIPEIHKVLATPLPPWVHAEALLALAVLEKQEPPVSSGSLTQLVQPVFYGDPQRPGQGGGGGLATLLRDLGGSLASRGMPVLTLSLQQEPDGLVPLEPSGTRKPDRLSTTDRRLAPEMLLSPGHMLVRLPVHLGSADPAGFLKASHRIARTMENVLKPMAGNRTTVHVRYLDDASRAAAVAARRLGLPLAMTLAPDPHRGICNPEGKILPRKPEVARELFNRILIGDELLSWCRGVVAIGRDAFAGELASWFPQLEDTRGRVLAGIDEGVDTSPARTDLDVPGLLCNSRLGLGLAEGRLEEASLVCVGRLNPVKGQASLARAWADSGLWQHYNLVFIGGNLEEPSPDERSIRDAIRSVLRPELRGKLCHLPAQGNDVVRGLLSWFAGHKPRSGCDFYVCPSLKEEFGLSILEAMAAGLPVCAPLNGGARTYMRHGTNGFLIDTRDALSLGRDLRSVLVNPDGQGIPWWNSPGISRIKKRARQTVEEAYSLTAMASEYAGFYRRMAL